MTVNSAARVTVTVISALLCMPHATAYVAGPGDANEPSQYASSDTLRRRTQRPGGDLSEPAVLQAAVQDRTFRGEIILFAFNFCSISDALALMATGWFELSVMSASMALDTTQFCCSKPLRKRKVNAAQ